MKKSIWNSAAYFLKYNIDEKYYVVSIDKKIEKNEPKSGWNDFLKRITNLEIYNLKKIDKIPNYYVCNDGDHLAIEIWKDNIYNSYDYPCYELYDDKIKEVKRIKKICLLIQEEFGYRLFPRPKI